MSERTTINVSKEAHRKAKESKRDDESWSDYIKRLSNGVGDGDSNDIELGNGYEQIAQRIAESLNDMQDNDPETQTVAVQQVLNRLDDLESQLPRKVAEEVHSR